MSRRRIALPIIVLAVASLVPGCSAVEDMSDAGATSPAGPDSAAPEDTGPADPPSPAAVVTTAESGPVSLTITLPPESPSPTITPSDDGAVLLTLTVVDTGPVELDLASGRFIANADGSLTVADGAGTPIGGLAPPAAVADADGTVSGSVHLASAGGPHAVLSAASTTTASLVLGSAGLRSATWGIREGGRSLSVDPTSWARSAGTAGIDTAWTQLVAVEPEANTPTMHDQFLCHGLGASDKAVWNLEPWRPAVGLLATMAARCNPR